MTYEQWCDNSKALIAECAKYNQWRIRTMNRVLTNLAPRIAALRGRMYDGCGFHYGKEAELGKLIGFLAVPYQWSANHCGKIPDQRCEMITTQVIAEGLFNDVWKAELSAAQYAKFSEENRLSA